MNQKQNNWINLSSALAAQMYAAQLSSQQQQNMYVQIHIYYQNISFSHLFIHLFVFLFMYNTKFNYQTAICKYTNRNKTTKKQLENLHWVDIR